MESEGNKYARLSAYDTMLRIDGSAFGVVLRDGYLSEDDSLIAAAVTCETLRSNGGVATVTGLPDNADGLSDPQKKQILGYGFNLKKIPGSVDWERACFSTYKHKEEGCHPSRFVSVRDGVISFRHDNSTGSFRRVDGEFIGTIELFYGGPILTVPAKLTLQ
ncbi:MAG: hypothetical protein CML66_28780 [Rhodobacteraceae bacterium]|nr:hypothetical protein [Paracoccaceae bacterium]MAY44065.1 hypothetical protein [Paracoccaceae bacterium]